MSHPKSAVILEMLELARYMNVITIFVVIDAKLGILHMVDVFTGYFKHLKTVCETTLPPTFS